jgi:hypothetical protein
MVVHPRHPEHHDAIRLDQAVEQALLGVPGMLFDEGPQALHDFGDGLQEFRLAGIAVGHVLQKLMCGRVFHVMSKIENV